MSEFSKRDYFDYAWKHFTLIADQRLKTFNFYIIIVAAFTAATIAGFDKADHFWLLFACGFLHIVCSAVFFLIDERSRRLVNTPKHVLIGIEADNGWALFQRDVALQEVLWNKVASYTGAFRLAFLSQFMFGVMVVIVAFASTTADQRTVPPSRHTHFPRPGRLPSPTPIVPSHILQGDFVVCDQGRKVLSEGGELEVSRSHPLTGVDDSGRG
jgi:hypothetical protein